MNTEFQNGANYIKELLTCTLIGWQNKIGYINLDDPEYKAYQNMIEFLEKLKV